MRSKTILPAISLPRYETPDKSKSLILAHRRLEGEGVQLAAHAPLQCPVDHLVLLDPCLALEGRRFDMGGIVIAIAAEVLDRDARIGKPFADQAFDHRRIHRHSNRLSGHSARRHEAGKPRLVDPAQLCAGFATRATDCQPAAPGPPEASAANPTR